MKKILPKERADLARQIGCSDQYLYQCLTRRRDMDATEAARAESVTNGRLCRSMLRRDWQETWPELAKSRAKPRRERRCAVAPSVAEA